MTISLLETVALVGVGFAGSMLGSSVGGGGFLVSSTLVALGLPPQVAVGTSRFAGIGSSATAVMTFSSRRKLDAALGLKLAVISCAGAVAGLLLLRHVPDLVWTLLAMGNVVLALVVFTTRSRLGVDVAAPATGRRKAWGFALYGITGLWVGFFGGGGSIVSNLLLILFFGHTFLDSAGTRKVPAFFVSVLTFALCAWQGLIDWERGFALLLGCTVGAYCGVRLVLRLGDSWFRRITIVFLIASLGGLFIDLARSMG